MLSTCTAPCGEEKITRGLCVDAHGFGLRVASPQPKELERLCRTITRPALANERLSRNARGQGMLQLKTPYLEAACGEQVKILAAIEDPMVIVRILTHLGLGARAPRAAARQLPLDHEA